VIPNSVEETLNALISTGTDRFCGAKRFAHCRDRVDTCAGSYERQLQQAAYQRCAVQFYHNVSSLVSSTKNRSVTAMLKSIHARRDRGRLTPRFFMSWPSSTRFSCRGRPHSCGTTPRKLSVTSPVHEIRHTPVKGAFSDDNSPRCSSMPAALHRRQDLGKKGRSCALPNHLPNIFSL